MDLLRLYPQLEGSHGQIRLRLSTSVLEQISSVLKLRLHGRVRHLRIFPTGENCFRVQAELSNRFYHHVGSMLLRVFREQGIEIHINQPSATRAEPMIDGWLDTSMIGSAFAIPTLISTLNDILGAGETVSVKKTKWLGWTNYRVFVAIHPFRILEAHLPAGMGHHVTDVRCETTSDSFYFDFHWRHTGQIMIDHRRSTDGRIP